MSEWKSLSCVWLFVTLWTVAHQAPLSVGFPRQEYWSELPFPSAGDLPNPGIEPRSPSLQADSLLPETTNCGIQDHLTCLLRNLYAGQDTTVRTRHGTTDWFKIGEGVHQDYILSPCLCNFYVEYIMWNAGLNESQAGIKTAGRNINSLKYADDATLIAESEEELNSLWMRLNEKNEKAGLKLKAQKTKIMASGPITLWQIDGGTMEIVTDFILGGSKITADGECIHEIKRHLLLGRKAMTNLDSVLKSRDITWLTKTHLVKAVVFPVVINACESWSIKKVEHWRTDVFELWCWRRLLRVPWIAGRWNQSILKEVNSEYSLEGLILKLKLQHLGHQMRRLTHWKRP